MLRIAGPPTARATGCRKESSRFAITCAMVAPPTVAIDTSPSLIARITSVPPARKRAVRSDCMAEAASPSVANVFTLIGILCSSRRQMPADRLKPRLVDLLAHHLGHRGVLARPRGKARLPAPEGAIAIRHRHQAHMRYVVEQRDRCVEQAIAEGLLKVRQREQLLAQLRAVFEAEAGHTADLVRGLPTLDRTGRDRRMPAVVAVEVAQHRPHPVHRCVQDCAFHDAGHLMTLSRSYPRKRVSSSSYVWLWVPAFAETNGKRIPDLTCSPSERALERIE